MHELAIAEAIISAACEEAQRAGGGRVVALELQVGELSGVVPHFLKSCFPIAALDGPVQDAKLSIKTTPGTGYCDSCQKEFPLPELLSPCPQCGSFASDIRAGRELTITSLELAEGETHV